MSIPQEILDSAIQTARLFISKCSSHKTIHSPCWGPTLGVKSLDVKPLTGSVYGIPSGFQSQSTRHHWDSMRGPCLGRVWSALNAQWNKLWYLSKEIHRECSQQCLMTQQLLRLAWKPYGHLVADFGAPIQIIWTLIVLNRQNGTYLLNVLVTWESDIEN